MRGSSAGLNSSTSAAGEMKLAREPSRSAPISHCMTPTITVTASAIWM